MTSDTGPMQLAAAAGTPFVAPLGPADPRCDRPRASEQRVLSVDLPCSPSGQVAMMISAAVEILDKSARVAHTSAR